MLKLFVLLLLLILTGSKQDALSDVDTEEVKKSDRLSYPCSSHISESGSKNKQLPNEERSSRLTSNEENNYDKIPIVLDCLVKAHEGNAMESVTETVKTENLDSRRSPDIKYLIETKDSFWDFTTKSNRSKISGEPTVYIDIAEKCTKIETKSQEKKIDSGRRNIIPYNDNIHETEQLNVNVTSSGTVSDLNLIPKISQDSMNNRSKNIIEVYQKLNTNKVRYGTTTSPTDHDQILKNKVTSNQSIQKSSTTTDDKKNPKDIFKPSTNKFDLLSALNISENSEKKHVVSHEVKYKDTKKLDSNVTPTDGVSKDSFVLLDFSNKGINDKPSIIYDLKSIFKNNKTIKLPLQKPLHEVNVEPNVIKNHENTFIPNNDNNNNLIVNYDLGNKAADEKYLSKIHDPDFDKEYHQDYSLSNGVTAEPSTTNNDQTTTPNNDKNNDLFIDYDISNKAANDTDIKLFLDHHPDHSDREDGDAHSTNKYEQTSTPIDIVSKAADANNIKLFMNHRNFTHNEDGDKDLIKKHEQTSSSNKDLILHNNPVNKKLSDKDINISKNYDQDLLIKIDATKLPTNKYEHNFNLTDEDFKDFLPYHDLMNEVLSNKNIKLSVDHYRNHTQKKDGDKYSTNKYEQTDDISKNLLLNQYLSNKAIDGKNIKIFKNNRKDILHRKDGNKLSNYEYEKTSIPYNDVTKDFLLYHDFDNKAFNSKNIKIAKKNHELLHKVDGNEETSTSYDDRYITKDLLLYHDLINNAIRDKYINLPKVHHRNLIYREDGDKQTSTGNGSISKESLLYHNLGISVANNKNINITKENQDLSQKENNDEYINYKFEKKFSSNDEFFKDLFLLLSLGNKAFSDTNIKVFKDNYQELNQKQVGDKHSSDNKYDKKYLTQISKENKKDLDYKKINNNLSTEKYGLSTMLKDDIHKDLVILHDLREGVHENDSSEIHDLNQNYNNFNEHNQIHSYRKNADKLSNNKYYDQSYVFNHNLIKNLYPYQGDISKKNIDDKYSNKKYDLKFTVNNEIPKEKEPDHKENSSFYAIKGSNSYETPEDELKTTIDVKEPHLVEPTTGYSIKDLFKARVMLLESTRVCYACSSISDHSCWQPSRRTTVKYCRKGHNACLTKTFKTEESEFIVIRDCDTTCDGTWPVLNAKYKSCSICHEDMCNDHLIDINSGHINNMNLLYFASITVVINFVV